ncbi:MAG TPA: TolC family protein [Chthonomonadaceae bacterium]|nr:TolC family protein [Chthonomonadaceae bacterium]
MSRPVCLRALAASTLAIAGMSAVPATAGQSTSTNSAQPPVSPAAAAPPASSTHPSPSPGPPPVGSAANAGGSSRQTSVPGDASQTLTPAQEKYGLPKTPIVGGPVDTDLTKPLSLDRAVRIGLQRQNTIAIAKTQTDAAEGRLIQARSSYFPMVTPTFNFQSNLSPGGSIFINGQRIGGSATSENRTEVVAAHQLIWDSGKREAGVGIARRNLFATQYGLGNSRQDVVLNVTTGYFNLLRDRELVRVQQESVKRAEETYNAIEAEFMAGTAARSDTLQAQSDLANARVSLLSAQNDYRVQEASLKNAMGVVSNAPLVLDDSPIPAPATTPDAIPLERYIQTAYVNRLDVKQQQELVYSQGYNVRVAKINAGVSVQADVTEGYQFDPISGEERVFSVSATYPLFDAGNARAAVRENKAQWEQEKRTLDQIEQNVRLAVDQSFSAREIAKQRLLGANLAVSAAQENYNAALAKNKEGLINILELITAEVQLINAQVAQVQAIYDYYTANAQLQRDIGLNDPVYLPKVPGIKPPIQPTP